MAFRRWLRLAAKHRAAIGMHDRDLARDEADVRHVADESRPSQMGFEQRIMESSNSLAPAKAHAVERDEIARLSERCRECVTAAPIPTIHGAKIQGADGVCIARTTTVNHLHLPSADKSSPLSRSGSARTLIWTILPPAIENPSTENGRLSALRATIPILPFTRTI